MEEVVFTGKMAVKMEDIEVFVLCLCIIFLFFFGDHYK